MIEDLLVPTLRQTTPLVLAGLGGIFSERVGVINIALEGMMLISAFVGMWVGQVYGLGPGLAAAVVSGGALGLLHVVFTQKFRMNHIISGVAINILAVNGTTFLLRKVFNQADPPREARLPDTIPVGWFFLATLLFTLIVHFALYKTSFGLRLRAVGESPESARMAGIAPLRLRIAGVALSGVFAGLSGAYLALSQVGRFSDDMVSGRGFIALAAVICGRWTPVGAALAGLVFGFFDALQLQLQGTVRLPGEFLRSLPYVFTILAAMLLKPTPPAALGREEEE
jgi:simple sugar transport system permease protein